MSFAVRLALSVHPSTGVFKTLDLIEVTKRVLLTQMARVSTVLKAHRSLSRHQQHAKTPVVTHVKTSTQVLLVTVPTCNVTLATCTSTILRLVKC